MMQAFLLMTALLFTAAVPLQSAPFGVQRLEAGNHALLITDRARGSVAATFENDPVARTPELAPISGYFGARIIDESGAIVYRLSRTPVDIGAFQEEAYAHVLR